MKTLFMETTKIAASKTVGEIMSALVKSGHVETVQQKCTSGEVTGVAFSMMVEEVEMFFVLPADPAPIFVHLQGKRSPGYRTDKAPADLEQARRVAWRQILRWVLAQMALIEAGMVEPAAPFIAYAQVQDAKGGVLFDRIKSIIGTGRLALPEPSR